MKHAIERYPEVAQNPDFVGLLTATITAVTELPRITREVTVSDHRAGTISAYLHSNLQVPCCFHLMAENPTVATTIADRTGFFCECQSLAEPMPNMVYTTFGLALPEQYHDDDALQAAVARLWRTSLRALVLSAGQVTNQTGRITAGFRTYRPEGALIELLAPQHHFHDKNGNVVMAWFR